MGEVELAPLEPRLWVEEGRREEVGRRGEVGRREEDIGDFAFDKPPLAAVELPLGADLAESSPLSAVSSASIFTTLSFRFSAA